MAAAGISEKTKALSQETVEEFLANQRYLENRSKIADFAKTDRKVLYTFARSRFGLYHEEAEELVQDTFAKALRYASSFEDRGYGVKPWMYRILFSELINTKRKNKRYATYSLDEILESGTVPKSLLCETPSIRAGEIKDQIKRLKDNNATGAELLADYVFHNYTYEDLAKIYELPIGTVKSRICRARRTLKKYINNVIAKNTFLN